MNSLFANTSGSDNTASGNYALRNNTTGEQNTAFGASSGYTNSTGSRNVFLGYNAGYNETGSDKLYIANSAANPPLIYGDFSTNFVGLGTASPAAMLEIDGASGASIKIIDGNQAAGKVLTSDANGQGSWQTPSGGAGSGGALTAMQSLMQPTLSVQQPTCLLI